MEIILLLFGAMLVLIYYLRTGTNDDMNFVLFILSNVGLWFLIIAIFMILNSYEIVHSGFPLIAGIAAGLLIGFRSLIFWLSGSNLKGTPPEEAIGSAGIGCFGFFFHLLAGFVSGLII